MPIESIESPATSDDSRASSLKHISFRTKMQFHDQCLKQDKVTFNHKTVVNIYIVYEINLCLFKESPDFLIGNVFVWSC